MRKLIARTALGLTALLLGVAIALPSSAATSVVEKPFKIKGAMVLTPVDPEESPGLYAFVEIGESTFMGRYKNVGWIQFNLDGTIAAGAGRCTAASGDYNNWEMEPNTGRVLSLGGIGRFKGAGGYFDSYIKTLVPNPDGTINATYTGEGIFTFPKGKK